VPRKAGKVESRTSRGTSGGLSLLPRGPTDATIETVEETISRLSRREAETSVFEKDADKFRGDVMTTKSNIAKYLLIRTVAFIGLTAASTAVMALPYLA
jgi:hypothetical protein